MSEQEKIHEELLEKLIDFLQDTHNSLDEGVKAIFGQDKDENFLTEKDKEFIDDKIFLCETCQWWKELADSGDAEGNCRDCLCTQGLDPDEEE